MPDIPYSFVLMMEVGFGTRIVTICAPEQGLGGHYLITPLRAELSAATIS